MQESEAVAAALFGNKLKQPVIEAALADKLNSISSELRMAMTRTALRRRPFTAARCLVAESFRLLRRMMQPTGLLVAIMGPDGVGKSTLIQDLMKREWLEFQSRRTFHWRPQFIGKRPDVGPLTDPHGASARGAFGSLPRLAGFFADYWLGYIFMVAPKLVRSGLVLFDRYFDDITIDSARYRYGGPSWLPRLLARLVPRPDMIVVLDADAERILARKREVQEEEMAGLLQGYAEFARRAPDCVLISTNVEMAETSLTIRRALVGCMSRRFEHRFSRWLGHPQSSSIL